MERGARAQANRHNAVRSNQRSSRPWRALRDTPQPPPPAPIDSSAGKHSPRLRVGPEVGVDPEGATVHVSQPVGGLERQANIAGVSLLLQNVRESDQLKLVADTVPGHELRDTLLASLIAEDVGGRPSGQVARKDPAFRRVQYEPIPGGAGAPDRGQRGLVGVDRLLPLVGEGEAHHGRALRVPDAVLFQEVPQPEVETLLGVVVYPGRVLIAWCLLRRPE